MNKITPGISVARLLLPLATSGVGKMPGPDFANDWWQVLIPKLREAWPKLTDPDIRQVDGNLELLVTKVSDRYGMKRPEVLQQLKRFLAA